MDGGDRTNFVRQPLKDDELNPYMRSISCMVTSFENYRDSLADLT